RPVEATRPIRPWPTGSVWLTPRRAGDIPRSPRRCNVLPSSDRRWRLAISWPVTRVNASTAVRSTSSTSRVRLTAPATVWRIARCGSTAGRAAPRRRPSGRGRERARRFKRGLDERAVRSGQVAQVCGDGQEQLDLLEVLGGDGRPAGGDLPRGGERRRLQAGARGC